MSNAVDPRAVMRADNAFGIPACFYWTVDDVVNWVESIGYAKYKENFRTHAINGRKLLTVDSCFLPKMGITNFGDILDLKIRVSKLVLKSNSYNYKSYGDKKPWRPIRLPESLDSQTYKNIQLVDFSLSTKIKEMTEENKRVCKQKPKPQRRVTVGAGLYLKVISEDSSGESLEYIEKVEALKRMAGLGQKSPVAPKKPVKSISNASEDTLFLPKKTDPKRRGTLGAGLVLKKREPKQTVTVGQSGKKTRDPTKSTNVSFSPSMNDYSHRVNFSPKNTANTKTSGKAEGDGRDHWENSVVTEKTSIHSSAARSAKHRGTIGAGLLLRKPDRDVENVKGIDFKRKGTVGAGLLLRRSDRAEDVKDIDVNRKGTVGAGVLPSRSESSITNRKDIDNSRRNTLGSGYHLTRAEKATLNTMDLDVTRKKSVGTGLILKNKYMNMISETDSQSSQASVSFKKTDDSLKQKLASYANRKGTVGAGLLLKKKLKQ